MTVSRQHYDLLVQGLKDAGLKLTRQRLAILELLADSRAHPTVAAIYQQLHGRFPAMSQTTVYNTLDSLVKLGLIHEIGRAGDDAAHYDADTDPHVNVVCQTCGKIIDMPADNQVPSLATVAQRSGFEIHGARIVYYGLCTSCARSARKAAR
jgi:Fur family peroxide stress response transcriptional regulator